MDTKVAKEGLIYLYCVTDKVPKLKEIENLAEKPYFIYYQDLYAVVSTVKENEFSEESLKKNLANLEWVKTKASLHEKIIEGVMNPALSTSKRCCEVRKGWVENSCVIPFKFATIFNSDDNLKVMLEEHAEVFKENLKNLEGKEEWGIKIYCDMEMLKKTVTEEEVEILRIGWEMKASSPGKVYLLEKRNDELIKNAVNKGINEYGKVCFERLKELSLDARINKLLPKEVTEKEDEMILNAAFLINKNKVADFIQIVTNLKDRYHDKGIKLDCTGPWPPYNFCAPLKR